MLKIFKRLGAPAGAIGRCPYCFAWQGVILEAGSGEISSPQRYEAGGHYSCSGCQRHFPGHKASIY